MVLHDAEGKQNKDLMLHFLKFLPEQKHNSSGDLYLGNLTKVSLGKSLGTSHYIVHVYIIMV